jgi:hypothetical protein
MAKAKKEQSPEDKMSQNEKHNDGTMSGLKKTVIGTISTLVIGGGTFLMSYLQKPKDDVKANGNQPAININIPSQQQQPAAATSKTVIIREKAGTVDNVTKKTEQSEKPKSIKKEGDEFKKEDPKW